MNNDQPTGNESPQTTTNPYNTPPKKNIGLIVGIIIVAILLISGGVAASVIIANNNKDKESSRAESGGEDADDKDDKKDTAKDDDAKLRAANAKTADSMSDLSAVCETGSITNAAAYEKPYKVAAFSKSSERRSWSNVSLEYDAAYATKYDEFATANVIACLEEDEDAAVKSQSCEFKSGGEAVNIDYYATTYTLTVYEAKSGKKIKELGTVSAPATTCPMFASYNKNDPKLIASPDKAAVDALIAKFAS